MHVHAAAEVNSRNLRIEDWISRLAETDITQDYRRGWDAALEAVRLWHQDQAKKALIQARKSRFPKNLEREADVHTKSAELIGILSPDDV